MRTYISGALCVVTALLFAGIPVRADTLTLRNGNVVEGKLIGRSDTGVRFQVGNEVHFYNDSEVRSIALAPGSDSAQAVAVAPASTGKQTLPAGTLLLVRFTDSVHTGKDAAGKRFSCTLETALKVDGTTVIPSGSKVYGKVLSASQANAIVGKSKMVVTLTEINVNDELKSIVTEELHLSGDESGKGTLKRAGAGAAIGGVVGGGSGAGKGAAIGAALGLLGRGSATGIPAGELLEFRLKEGITVTSGP